MTDHHDSLRKHFLFGDKNVAVNKGGGGNKTRKTVHKTATGRHFIKFSVLRTDGKSFAYKKYTYERQSYSLMCKKSSK